MLQHNQIGKKRKKQDILNAKKGRTFVTPNGENYVFDWKIENRTYIMIIECKGQKMQVKESDFNVIPIDELINCIKKELPNL